MSQRFKIKNPKFYLDVFSIFKNLMSKRSKSVYKKKFQKARLLDTNNVDQDHFYYDPPLKFRKKIYYNNTDVPYPAHYFDHYFYDIGLTPYTYRYSIDTRIKWAYETDYRMPLYPQFMDEAYGNTTGLTIDGLFFPYQDSRINFTGDSDFIIRIQSLANDDNNSIVNMMGVGITDGINITPNWIDNDTATGTGWSKCISPGYAIIEHESIPIHNGKQQFVNNKKSITKYHIDVASINRLSTGYLTSGTPMPFMKFELPNPDNDSVEIKPNIAKSIKAQNGSEYTYYARNKNATTINEYAQLKNTEGNVLATLYNPGSDHKGRTTWSLEYDNFKNFISDTEQPDDAVTSNRTSTTNIFNYDELTAGTSTQAERTKDVVTNLFAYTNAGKIPFVFQPNSDYNDFRIARVSNITYSVESNGVGFTPLSLDIEEVFL